MPIQGIPSSFYPTTTVLVDDEPPFLRAMRGSLGDAIPMSVFESAANAVEAVRAARSSSATNLHRTATEASVDRERMNQVTVLVSDYRMPEMTGVELFQKMRGDGVKKIILTGQMDNGSAVSLFNDGLIDRFVQKGHDDMVEELKSYIEELQLDLFMDRDRAWADDDAFASLVRDRLFCDWFGRFRQQNGFVEYYRVPEGFLMVDRDGAASLLAVKGQLELERDIARATGELQVPRSVIDRIRAREVLLCLPAPFVSVGGDGPTWEAYLHPARQILGDRDMYFFALVNSAHPHAQRFEWALEDQLRLQDDAGYC